MDDGLEDRFTDEELRHLLTQVLAAVRGCLVDDPQLTGRVEDALASRRRAS